jgi:hypothetical protein
MEDIYTISSVINPPTKGTDLHPSQIATYPRGDFNKKDLAIRH